MGEDSAELNRHVSVSKDQDANSLANPIYVHVVNQSEVTDAVAALQAALLAELGDLNTDIVAAINALSAANSQSFQDLEDALVAAIDAASDAEITALETCCSTLDGALQDIEDLIQSEMDATQVLLQSIKDSIDNLEIEVGDVSVDAVAGPTYEQLKDGAEITVSSTAIEIVPEDVVDDRGTITITHLSGGNVRVGNSNVTASSGTARLRYHDVLSFNQPLAPLDPIYAVREGSTDATLLVSCATAIPPSELDDAGYGAGEYGDTNYGN